MALNIIMYVILYLQYHPDKISTDATPTEREESIRHFHRLSHAYHMLSDDITRQHHDTEQRAKKLTEELIINENILITEMEVDDNIYWHECRCGGVYIVRMEQMKKGESELIVACDTCSLHIRVIFK